MTKTLLTASEVAELLCVSASTVHRWVERGLLTPVRLPSGTLRFRAEDIKEIVGAA